jgi:hypothetical protein
MRDPVRSYDVAISFGRSARHVAQVLAGELKNRYSVFYDFDERSALWGSNLLTELPERYRVARLCVILLSDDYVNRIWPRLERDSIAQDHVGAGRSQGVLCFRLSQCSIDVPPDLAQVTISVREDSTDLMIWEIEQRL